MRYWAWARGCAVIASDIAPTKNYWQQKNACCPLKFKQYSRTGTLANDSQLRQTMKIINYQNPKFSLAETNQIQSS